MGRPTEESARPVRPVPREERQLTLSLVTMVATGLPWSAGPVTGSPSLGYRFATPRWSVGVVAEVTASPDPALDGEGGLLHASLSFSARAFLSPSPRAIFVGGGAGLLSVRQEWSLPEAPGRRGREFSISPLGGDETRSLTTYAPVFEAGVVAGRTYPAQLVASLRLDLPLGRMDGGGHLRSDDPRAPPRSKATAYVAPISDPGTRRTTTPVRVSRV